MKSKIGPNKSINLTLRIEMIGIVGNAPSNIVLWGYWFDQHKEHYAK